MCSHHLIFPRPCSTSASQPSEQTFPICSTKTMLQSTHDACVGGLVRGAAGGLFMTKICSTSASLLPTREVLNESANTDREITRITRKRENRTKNANLCKRSQKLTNTYALTIIVWITSKEKFKIKNWKMSHIENFGSRQENVRSTWNFYGK